MTKAMQAISFYTTIIIVLFLFSTILFLIYNQRTNEIFKVVVGFSVCLLFLNIHSIKKFSFGLGGVKTEMQETIAEANATIKQLRIVAATTGEVVLSDLMSGIFAFGGISVEERIRLHDQIVSNLKDIGVKDSEIKKTEDNWIKGLKLLFCSSIRQEIEKRGKSIQDNTQKQQHKDLIADLNLKFKGNIWDAPTSSELKSLIDKYHCMNNKIEALLLDYEKYEKTGKLNDNRIFD